MSADQAGDKKQDRKHRPCKLPACGKKIDQGKGQKNAAENKKRDRRTDSRNRYKSRKKRTNNASDRIVCAQRSDNFSAVIQTVHSVFDQRRRHCSKQEQWKYKNDHARKKRRYDQKISIDRNHQQSRDP